MKVLFAVNDEKISESIIKRYQKDYKEIISGKNVYYYNAIIKELQKDKSYDRIVIGEDLEPFSSDDYSTIDKFLFDKLDKISDEAYNTIGNDIPIILICTDRRTKPEPMLVKLFGISVYNALIGQDRSIEQVCKLIKKPRSKKEAKNYYRIDSEKVEYKPENESDVSETEIQNILAHYKKLGKNEEKYVTSFDSIVSQYSDEQLKLIINFLPQNVLKVLEERSNKYRELIGLNPIVQKKSISENNNNQRIEMIDKQLNKTKLSTPVIIPSAVDTQKVKRVIKKAHDKVNDNILQNEEKNNISSKENVLEEEQQVKPVKRGRGRPPKEKKEEQLEKKEEQSVKKGRGRPSKKRKEEVKVDDFDEQEDLPEIEENKLQGFEDLNQATENIEEFEMPGFDDETLDNGKNEESKMPGIEDEDEEYDDEDEIPGFEDDDDEEYEVFEPEENDDEEYEMPGFEEDDEISGFEEKQDNEEYDEYEEDNDIIQDAEEDDDNYIENENSNYQGKIQNVNFNNPNQEGNINNSIQNRNYSNSQMDISIDSLLSSDKKIVSFVGTTKNGTSFLVNNLAQMLSEKGIKTAILDLTQNRNAYYVYTDNREELRNIAFRCIENLRNGIPEGIDINKNLTVYTSLPDDIEGLKDSKTILETLLSNYSLILLDCDYFTDYSYFNMVQEIYLVQSLDVLTIQPLTAFLRELKARNILDPNKLRVVINKYVKSQITNKMLIGGISSYNDPSMSYMTELFNKDKMKYITIPLEIQNYSKYLESLVDCKISLRGYSKNLLKSLSELENTVFPLIGNGKDKKQYNAYNNNFSKNTNNILNKMKTKY